MSSLSAADFDFELPDELIAQTPAAQRDESRLLLVGQDDVAHHTFAALPDLIERYVGERPLLIVNDSKVLLARLYTRKLAPDGTLGGRVELLLLEPLSAQTADAATWRVMYRTSKPLRPQATLLVLNRQGEPIPGQTLTVSSVEGEGRAVIDFPTDVPLGTLLDQAGELPLPPYIVKQRQHSGLPAQPDDQERYQTVYAKVLGSVAAPTAGLHFTDALLAQLQRRGIERHSVTLHVGPGTFLPLRDDDPQKHVMHAERFHIPPETAEAIACARKQGRKVLAVGTTVVRTLESATPEGQSVPTPGFGESRLFIYPQPPTGRYPFRVVDALITNFHLPRSTLLMLVSAFAGRERILAAYQQAILARYRFYSYGDAMLLPTRM
jgi:S-adenosylmethionine:tRNA ribosyltransferase-isomerase